MTRPYVKQHNKLFFPDAYILLVEGSRGSPIGRWRLCWLDMSQIFRDGVTSRRNFWCQLPETFHLEARKGVSKTILEAWKMNCCEGKKGNGPEGIHDARDFGAFCIDDGQHCLVVTGEMHVPIMP